MLLAQFSSLLAWMSESWPPGSAKENMTIRMRHVTFIWPNPSARGRIAASDIAQAARAAFFSHAGEKFRRKTGNDGIGNAERAETIGSKCDLEAPSTVVDFPSQRS